MSLRDIFGPRSHPSFSRRGMLCSTAMNQQRLELNRRRFLECFSAGGIGLMPGALMAVAQDSARITLEMLQAAEKIAGMSFSGDERQAILAHLNSAVGP